VAAPPQGHGAEREALVGTHPVLEALRAGRRTFGGLWICESRRVDRFHRICEAARALGIEIKRLERDSFEERFGNELRTQGVALEVGPLPLALFESFLHTSKDEVCLLALDGIEDPHNLGAIIRVAEAAGADGLLVAKHRSAPLGAATARASAGAMEHLPIARVANLGRALAALKEAGFWVLGADAETGEDLFSVRDAVFTGKKVLVLGAEGQGIRVGVRKQLDLALRIPMAGRIESLNVSTAAAVCLFEFKRRRECGALP